MSDESSRSISLLRERVELLEKVVELLADSILAHEYAKDLNRCNKEDALQALQLGDIPGAVRLYDNSD